MITVDLVYKRFHFNIDIIAKYDSLQISSDSHEAICLLAANPLKDIQWQAITQ